MRGMCRQRDVKRGRGRSAGPGRGGGGEERCDERGRAGRQGTAARDPCVIREGRGAGRARDGDLGQGLGLGLGQGDIRGGRPGSSGTGMASGSRGAKERAKGQVEACGRSSDRATIVADEEWRAWGVKGGGGGGGQRLTS